MIQKKPLVNDLYTADPSAHAFNGKIYIYPSHDEDEDVENNDNGDQYNMKDYHVYEMQDENTLPKDCGCVLKLEDIKWASKQLWAPDCAEKDGKYYFVFPARDKEGMFRIGMAIGDKPQGPFKPEDNYIQGTYSIDPASSRTQTTNTTSPSAESGAASLTNTATTNGAKTTRNPKEANLPAPQKLP